MRVCAPYPSYHPATYKAVRRSNVKTAPGICTSDFFRARARCAARARRLWACSYRFFRQPTLRTGDSVIDLTRLFWRTGYTRCGQS